MLKVSALPTNVMLLYFTPFMLVMLANTPEGNFFLLIKLAVGKPSLFPLLSPDITFPRKIILFSF
jgi:hypothetical protein